MQKNCIRLLGVQRTLQLDKGVQPAKKVEKAWPRGTDPYNVLHNGNCEEHILNFFWNCL